MRAMLIAVSALWASAGWSQPAESGGYLGVGLGNFSYEEELLPGIYTFDESATDWKLFGGYNWTENWGVEASWVQTDTLEVSVSEVDPDFGTISASIGVEFSALAIRGMGHLPFSWGSLFAGLGFFDGDADAELTLITDEFGSESASVSSSESGATALLGAQWSFDSWNARIEYEWWDLDAADASAFGIALAYRF